MFLLELDDDVWSKKLSVHEKEVPNPNHEEKWSGTNRLRRCKRLVKIQHKTAKSKAEPDLVSRYESSASNLFAFSIIYGVEIPSVAKLAII